MKGFAAFLLVIFLMLTLSACQLNAPNNTAPATEPPVSLQPPETTAPAHPSQTVPTETDPAEWDMWILHHNEIYTDEYFSRFGWQTFPDLSSCVIGHLYYFYYTDHMVSEVHTICNEPVVAYRQEDINLYYVKESEPTKLYRALLANPTEQTVIYQSGFGAINDIQTFGLQRDLLGLTEGNRRGVLLDLVTGKIEVYIEQYYMLRSQIGDDHLEDGKFSYNKIFFRGKLSEEDPLKDYLYYIDTGKIFEVKY